MRSLVAFAFAYAAGAGLQKGLGFLLLLWLAYVLTAAEYAVFGLLWALQVGVATVAGAGIAERVVALLKDHRDPDSRNRLLSSANGVFVYLAAVAVSLSVIVYALPIWSVDLELGTQLAVTLGGLLAAYLTLAANLVRLEERHIASIAFGTVAPLFGQAAAFVAVFALRNVPAFYFGTAIGLAAAFVVLFWSGLGHFRVAWRLSDTTLIRQALSPFVLIALISWVVGYGYAYVVGYWFQDADVARFAFAYTLSSVMHLVATSTNQVWSPRFFRLVHELPIRDVEARNVRFFAIQGVALGVIGALVLITLPAIIDYFGGNLRNYRDMQLELVLLLSGYAVSIPWWHSQNYYLVHGFASQMRDVVLVTTIVGLAVWLGLMGLLGPIGIYVGFAGQMLIRSVGTWIWARKHWAIRMAWHGPVIAGALIVLGGICAQALFPPTVD
jgi:O-antigen/teichoic acid export membrane protein